jgi:hypothetical protein
VTVDREDAIAEYDAFGPWVARVTSAPQVPPLFRGWVPDPATVDVMVKVPRTVHRRDTHAGADLYDHVLWVAGGALTQLTRAAAAAAAIGAPEDVEGGVLRRQVPLARVVAVEDSGELLDAVLTLRMDDGTALDVPYSGTSRPVMAELAAAVRASWRPAVVQDGPGPAARPVGVGGAPPLRLDDLGPDVALVTEQRDLLRAEPGLVLLAAHGRRVVALEAPGPAARMRERVQPWVLQGAAACADAHELVLLHRRAWVTRTRKPELSMVRTVLSLDRVRRLTPAVQSRPSGYDGVVELVLGRGAATLLVPAGGDVERALEGLLVARAVCGTLEP